ETKSQVNLLPAECFLSDKKEFMLEVFKQNNLSSNLTVSFDELRGILIETIERLHLTITTEKTQLTLQQQEAVSSEAIMSTRPIRQSHRSVSSLHLLPEAATVVIDMPESISPQRR